jgi:hypothetical protein
MRRPVQKGILSVVVSVAAVIVSPVPADAQGRRASACVAPSGVDDTEVLRSALERCTGSVRRCLVSLCEGVFETAPVRVKGFNGVLRGAGRERTVIRPLPSLHVNENPLGYWRDDPLDPGANPWPFLLQFIEGRATIRDLGFEIPQPAPGERPTSGWSDGWNWRSELAGAILFTGREPVQFDVRRVRIAAAPDAHPDSFLGTTLLAGIHFQGLLFNPDDGSPYPVHPVRGRLHVSDCELVGMISGTPLWELADARVTIARNRYRTIVGMDVVDVTRSSVAIYDNDWDVDFVGAEVLLNLDGEPSEMNRFLVVNNRGSVGSPGSLASGVFFWDLGTFDSTSGTATSSVVFAGNRLALGVEGNPAESGLVAWGADQLWVYANALGGWASAGIRVDDTTGCRVLGNALPGLDTGDGPDLELGFGTSSCLAVVGPADVVLDEGTDNRIFRP